MDTAELQYQAYHLFWQGVDLLFPPRCAGCDRPGVRWCETCQGAVQEIAEPLCVRCGLPLEKSGLCPSCQKHPPAFEKLRAWAVFQQPLRRALHQMKYRRNLGLGESLALQMLPFVQNLDWKIDVFIPVPLSQARFRERGYNQVGLVARPLALLMRWPYETRALRRVRETRSQVGLSARERRLNVQDAFWADARLVDGKRVLLMDDVATTGATLHSAAQTLRSAGALQVYALTLARALPQHGLSHA